MMMFIFVISNTFSCHNCDISWMSKDMTKRGQNNIFRFRKNEIYENKSVIENILSGYLLGTFRLICTWTIFFPIRKIIIIIINYLNPFIPLECKFAFKNFTLMNFSVYVEHIRISFSLKNEKVAAMNKFEISVDLRIDRK